MNDIHSPVSVSHFAECHKKWLATVREMLINLLKSRNSQFTIHYILEAIWQTSGSRYIQKFGFESQITFVSFEN